MGNFLRFKINICDFALWMQYNVPCSSICERMREFSLYLLGLLFSNPFWSTLSQHSWPRVSSLTNSFLFLQREKWNRKTDEDKFTQKSSLRTITLAVTLCGYIYVSTLHLWAEYWEYRRGVFVKEAKKKSLLFCPLAGMTVCLEFSLLFAGRLRWLFDYRLCYLKVI